MSDYIHKDNAVEYVLENYYDEVREAVFEQEAESRQNWLDRILRKTQQKWEMVRKMIKYTFDLDQTLYEDLVIEAEKNDRSVAAQLRVILKERFERNWNFIIFVLNTRKEIA